MVRTAFMGTYHFSHAQEPRLNAYIVFFLAASFYLYEYILQVAPSVMAEPMMQTFHVTAKGFGIVSAFYFYAYAPMQLPAGLLFDRYGPRRLMTFALVLCALGSFFFASTDQLITAAMGRFFIGIGSAFSFIGLIVLLSRWFPPTYFAVLAGIAQLMSSVGAIFGEVPLAALVQHVGWRQASFILSLLGLALAVLMWCVIRDYPGKAVEVSPRPRFREEWKRLLKVCGRANTWIVGAYACSIWTPIAVFGSLWGVPYLQQRFGLSLLAASGLCSMIWIGIGVGSPFLGWLSDRCCSRKLALFLSAMCGLTASWFLLYSTTLTVPMMYIVLFFFGFGAGGQTVSFAVLNDTVSHELVGTASGFNNLSVLIGGAVFQPLVGIMLDRYGAVERTGDAIRYSVESYQHALLVLPVSFLLALLIAVCVMKETHPLRRNALRGAVIA